MKRHLLTAAFMLALSGLSGAFAQEISLTGISPASGSDIDTFNFTLTFDISSVPAEHGEGEYGIGWLAGGAINIYKGLPDDGTLVGSLYTKAHHAGSAGWEPTDKLAISLPDFAPQPGVTYTVQVDELFYVFKKGERLTKYSEGLDCNVNYTFKGAAQPAADVLLTDVSPAASTYIEELETVSYSFNRPVTYSGKNPINVTLSDATVVSSSNVVMSADGLTATVTFPKTLLNVGKTYSVDLPAGAFISQADPSYVSHAYSYSIKGNYHPLFGTVKSSVPADGATGVFDTVAVTFDMVGKLSFRDLDAAKYWFFNPLAGTTDGYLYEVNEDGTIGKKLPNYIYATCKGDTPDVLYWKLRQFSPEPGKKYLFNVPEWMFGAYNPATPDKYDRSVYNPEINVYFTAPTLEQLGAPPVEVGDPIFYAKGSVIEGGKYDYVGAINIPLKGGKYYTFNGIEYKTYLNAVEAKIYDITDEYNPVFVKSCKISGANVSGQSNDGYSINVASRFYSGHKYRIVVPEHGFELNNIEYYNYFISPEWSCDFYGATPAGMFKASSCSVADNADLSSLNVVVWKFDGSYNYNGVKALFGGDVLTPVRTTVSDASGVTTVMAHCYDPVTGIPAPLKPGEQYKVVLPEGILFYPGASTVKNAETVLTVNGVSDMETVNLSVIRDNMSSEMQTLKDASATLNLLPGDGWSVSKLSHNGNDVTASVKEGAYTTPALDLDSNLVVTLAYTGEWAEEQSDGSWTISGTDITIHGEDGMIVVSGAPEDSAVNVYTEGGSEIGTATSEGKPLLISASTGNTYIVVTAAHAAKITL